MKKLIVRTVALIGAGVTGLVIGLAAGGGSSVPAAAAPVPAPTVTAPSVVVTAPGPTVTATATAQPPVLLAKTYNGSGTWNSPRFTLDCDSPVVTVTFSYDHNDDSNFIADIDAPGGAGGGSIANDIASSGGTSTTVYPQSFRGNSYYLSVTATGNWSFKLQATC